MATQVVRCMYCKQPAKMIDENGKKFLVCPKCGKKELTKLGIARHQGE